METLCEICGHVFYPRKKGVLPKSSGRTCDYCREVYAAY